MTESRKTARLSAGSSALIHVLSGALENVAALAARWFTKNCQNAPPLAVGMNGILINYINKVAGF